ncbi:hypothetical protein, conserved [Plasmodium gonderi]|uniref:Translation initiation factor eIF2B subunit epsilon n=1 Tax=Plasmodium gonderi TaxID=77519 RepID=A0A1Y1JM26_PLAGO|nr:hypothetical protein, conserved [Plasmodium gonderi]GAW83521.1 hypothetical protein, conserved [Plasmodium gonderi]
MKKDADFNVFYDEEKKNLVGLLVENNFDEIYEPLTTESLRLFLPLNGVYLIDYQLHFFKQNNIKKIYIIVTHHEKELLHYIEKFQKSKKRYHDLNIEIIKLSKKVKTLGDALRDFKKCVEIYHDVLLLLSDTIPIANVKEIIKAHFTNKEKCKNQIMTLFLSHCSDEYKSHNDDFVIGYDNFSFKLLLFESLKNKNYLILSSEIFDEVKKNDKAVASGKGKGKSGGCDGRKVNEISCVDKLNENKEHKFPLSNFNTCTNSIIISYDLVIPNIFIITPQVFKLFDDNFDYQCIKKDFIYNILKQEIKIEEIYVHILNNDYNYTECNQIITTLTDFRIYFKFFKTLIERNIHPFLANSSHLLPDLPKFTFSEPGLYKAKNAIINDTCKLLKIVLVENYTEILENTIIENSIICKNCKIGKNVKIVNSIIGKNSIIKDNVIILSSFVSENNIINQNVLIDECCVIGKNMNIPFDTQINKHTRLSVYKHIKEQMKLHKQSKKTEDSRLENEEEGKKSKEDNEDKDFITNVNKDVGIMKLEQFSNAEINGESTRNENANQECYQPTCAEVVQEEMNASKEVDEMKVEMGSSNEVGEMKENVDSSKGGEMKEDVDASKGGEMTEGTKKGTHECDIFNAESFDLNNFIVKTKYSEDQLRLFSLIGNAENYEKMKMANFSEYDSEEESDEDSVYSTSKNYSTLSDTNVSNKEDELNKDNSTSISDINNHFENINVENEKTSFVKEISLLCKEALEKPQYMSHKILEMKSFRLSLNYTDLDVIISFFPIFWDFINNMQFDKNTWVGNFDNAKLDLLFSSFLLDDQIYYETIYGLILDFSKKQYLENNVKNNIYGSDKLCGAFEYIYHSDIFEFNHFNEWVCKNEADEYLTNNKRLKAFAEWLSEE